MPKRAQRKRAQRRQHELEKDINTNGVEVAGKGGEFRVFSKKANQYISGPVNWAKANAIWQECPDCMILNYRHS